MTASKLTQQQTIINALQRGDVAVLDVLTRYELHDLEFAAEVWNARTARDVILAELDNRDPTAQQMVNIIKKAQTSAGIRVPLRLQGIEGRHVGTCALTEPVIGRWKEITDGITSPLPLPGVRKAPTRPVTAFTVTAAMAPLPSTYQRILAPLLERERLAAIDKQLAALGMPARRPGLATIEDAARTMLDAISGAKLDVKSWRDLYQRQAERPTYADRLKAERARLLKAHGYHLRHDEDGYGRHWVSPRGVPLKVRRRLAKLARMIDIASGKRPDCLNTYAFELQCRAPGISNRTLDRWLTAINPV